MASGPTTSSEIDGETVETVSDFISGGSKITVMVTAAMKLKDAYSLEGRLWPPSVQFSSVTQLCPTLYSPMKRSMPGLPVHHQLPIDRDKVETVTDFFLGSKITADHDCNHEIKRSLLVGRNAMTNLDSILKSRDITLPTKVHLVKAMVSLVITYGCERWTRKKAERWRIDAF